MINRNHKDRLFKFLFGNSSHKEWTLSLYNAVNGSSYGNADDIEITTIDDVIYMGMKNDVSFIISDTMNIYEQQCTFNPNMPIRMLMYAGRLYDKYIHINHKNVYSQSVIYLPIPKLVVFYNGLDEKENTILKLRDAFILQNQNVYDIEVNVHMININYGQNKDLLLKCKPLLEYSWLIDKIRKYSIVTNIDDAVDRAIDEMPDTFIIKNSLILNKSEVKNMCITEYNEAETMSMLREEFKQSGLEEGRKEGRKEGIIVGENNLMTLYSKLLSDGRNDDAQLIMNPVNEELRKKLYVEYGI